MKTIVFVYPESTTAKILKVSREIKKYIPDVVTHSRLNYVNNNGSLDHQKFIDLLDPSRSIALVFPFLGSDTAFSQAEVMLIKLRFENELLVIPTILKVNDDEVYWNGLWPINTKQQGWVEKLREVL